MAIYSTILVEVIIVDNYLTATEIKQKYRLSIAGLLHWEPQGVLHPVRTPGGHRRYSEPEILSMLDRQIESLRAFAAGNGYIIVTSFSARIYGKRGGRVAKKVTALIAKEAFANEDNR